MPAGPGELDLELPYGETASGFLGRLDAGPADAIGHRGLVTPFERPDVVARVLIGAGEDELLTPDDRVRRDDLVERLAFWREQARPLGLTNLRPLVDASIGLGHLLPAVVDRARSVGTDQPRFGQARSGDERVGEARLLRACREMAAYSEAERMVLSEDLIAGLEAEAERIEAEEAGRLARQEAERRARQEAEELARQEAARAAHQAAEDKRRREAEELARREAERERLRQMLSDMGLQGPDYRLLLILPLFQVAWSDGELSRNEAQIILDAARANHLLGAGDDHPIIEHWMGSAAPAGYFEAGCETLAQLASSRDYPDITPAQIAQVLVMCRQIANATGGFMGLGRKPRTPRTPRSSAFWHYWARRARRITHSSAVCESRSRSIGALACTYWSGTWAAEWFVQAKVSLVVSENL